MIRYNLKLDDQYCDCRGRLVSNLREDLLSAVQLVEGDDMDTYYSTV